ncbi:VOC family protein [Pseudomonas sp. LPB0260]|uniref:VOC family protein n=1 Tax=Pseudomonas sp. LPB0260 TaxID=2614442 RepID=UPI0015C229CF|nr:VOC family protein [Pseudomonas sp. LPB0260]QLC73592.1 VOC family protein [Pseudomonas sp. LPB0260]QLC76366.1 VOC family protein [Pseudomonas sp. LPB0260]
MNAINWFELFVEDFQRAQKFYEQALAAPLQVMDAMGGPVALLPYDADQGVGGCLSAEKGQRPGTGGTRVYLNAEGQLDAVLDRVPGAGGKILQTKTDIGCSGFIALIEDSEGNHVGLHSRS